MNSFESRIDLDVPLEDLARVVCEKYKPGKFADCKIIEIGYEDFNFILRTKSERYVVKVFAKSRTDEDCKNLADRATIPSEYGFSCPKIFKVGKENLLKIKIKKTIYRLLVMEYIDGTDFFTLDTLPSGDELKMIGVEVAKLNQIQYKPPFIYDKWAIVNFEKEFENCKSLLANEEREKVTQVLQDMKKCDFSRLKYGFVHGDIIVTNIIRENSGKLFFIDFSVSNYLPRIVDLAVVIGDLCLDLEDFETSAKRTKFFLEAYESVDKLNEYEKQCLKVFIKAHQATSICNALREKVLEGNDSFENLTFLEKSGIALDLLMKKDLF